MGDINLALRYMKEFRNLQQKFIDANNDIMEQTHCKELCNNLKIENDVYKSNIIILDDLISVLES